MRKLASLLSVLMLLCIFALGQPTRTVSGAVRDDKGEGVAFANITESGTKNTVQADAGGLFTIKIGQNGILIISSSSGFASRTFTPTEGFQVIVLSGAANMREVVVTALGIRRKPEEIGYSTATVKGDQITAGKSFNLAQALAGKVSGLVVSNTSASVNATPRIVLRGLRSLTGENQALIVLDGVPVPSNTINYLNPNDVDRVDIMKGGQAATLFGSEGVNGAIIITTKKGSQKPELTLSYTGNAEDVAYIPRTQHGFGSGSAYGSSRDENFHTSENQQYGPAYDGSIRPLGRVLSDGSIQLLPYSDIKDVRKNVWDHGFTGQSDMSYRAGDQNSSFFTSFQHLNSNGIVKGDQYKRNAIRFNASKKYGKFEMGFDATYTWDHAQRTNTDFYFFALNTPSWAPLDQYQDWKNNKYADLSGYFNDYYNNPWWLLDNNRFETKNNFFNGNIKMSFKPIQALEITARAAIAQTNSTLTTTSNSYTFTGWSKTGAWVNHFNNDYDRILTGVGRFVAKNPAVIPGGLSESASFGNRFNADILATYKKSFNDISLNAIIGSTMVIRTTKNIGVSMNGIGVPDLFNFTNTATGLYAGSNSMTEQRKLGVYGDLTLGYKGLAYLHGILRRDYTSVFSGPTIGFNNPAFTFYGGDISLIITDMIPSLKGKVLESLKIRGGYNVNGNDNLGPYQLLTTYNNAGGYPYSGLLGTTVGGTVVSPTLEPEKVQTSEIGFEASFAKNRYTLEGTYFHQSSEKQILNVNISSATGFQNYLLNAADVDNNGIEVDFRGNIFKNKDWNINVNANFTHSTNHVNNLYANTGLNSLQYQGDNLVSLNAEIGQMFPYLKTTVYERDPNGHIVIDPTDGWPVRATDMKGQGTTTPREIMGVGLNVSYKSFTLIANAEYRGGNLIYHDLGPDMTFTGSSAMTTLYERDQFVWPNSVYWDGTKYVTNTNIAVDNYKAIYQGFGDLSFSRGMQGTGEFYIASGAFWKLRDLSLTYDFPKSIMNKIKAVRGIGLTVWARNLFTLLPDDNWFTDPEFSNTSGNAQGINTSLNTPPTRQIGGTIKVIF